ncbi:MAG: peptidoglycan-binding domain-containing protein, partial [Haloechinothrix sp.]
YLYRMRGWQPWECANASFLDLRGDDDARSKRVPTYQESAYIGGGGEPEPEPQPPSDSDDGPDSMPPWPGVVYAYGDCARELRDFQLRMNAFDFDYTFTGTGCYYEQTKKAVLALQRVNGINDSGRLGPKTWKAAWHGKAPHG